MSKRRAHLVDVARQLFYERGFRATGIDTILERAGVAKMTLYNHFGSKDALILAALRLQDDITIDYYRAAVAARTSDPASQLLAFFDALADVIIAPEYNGCFFANAAAEFPGVNGGMRGAIEHHKHQVRGFLSETASQAGIADPEFVTRRLQILMEGLMVRAHVASDFDAIEAATEMAREVIEGALGRRLQAVG